MLTRQMHHYIFFHTYLYTKQKELVSSESKCDINKRIEPKYINEGRKNVEDVSLIELPNVINQKRKSVQSFPIKVDKVEER